MGAYLSQPATEKFSKDEHCDRLSYGASSMQGWRVSQEDSHNCIIDFDTDTSLFAVYDGHGGAEVANYCSMNLPDCLRSTADYKKGNYEQALENAFLEFDASLTKPEVILELKQIAGLLDTDEDSVEDARALREEASLPLDEVLARYETSAVKKVAPHVSSDYEKPKSPMLRGKNRIVITERNGLAGSSKTSEAESTSAVDSLPVNGEVDEKDEKETGSSPKAEDGISSEKSNKLEENKLKSKEEAAGKSSKSDKDNSKNDLVQPGCSSEVGSRRKSRKKGEYTVPQKSSSDEDDSEEDDKEYSAKHNSSEEEEDENEKEDGEEGKKTCVGEEEEEDEDDDDEDEDDEDEDDDSEEDGEDEESGSSDEECGMPSLRQANSEDPGVDSGCTAVVALLRGNKVFVANAGDSRCVISRNGEAINLSYDHKPEDKIESERIVNAGGKVTQDGRVNGGLNLSRAIGDHAYKCNEELPAKEQMITSLPDIQTLDIDPKQDLFMVLACDGIWNHMSSQEVVDFVNERISDDKELSSICEELFDHCLAPDTVGDGTGCDNMTAIIVKFRDLKKQGNKRQAESSDNEKDMLVSKKLKVDESTD